MAIKVIDKKKARQDSYVLKNMKREPRIHQMVRHPHIVVLLEVKRGTADQLWTVGGTSLCLLQTLETENSYYMAMELCAGGDLMDRICEKKRLEEREVRRYIRQILSAVDHLHKHGIVHRSDYKSGSPASYRLLSVFIIIDGCFQTPPIPVHSSRCMLGSHSHTCRNSLQSIYSFQSRKLTEK